MSFRERVQSYIPPPVRRLPIDLAIVLALIPLTWGATSLPVVRETPIRAVVSLPFLLFAPGYAFVSAVFPEREVGTHGSSDVAESAPSRLKRLVFSIGSSAAIIPLVGFALNATPWGFRLVPVLCALSVFVVVLVAIAVRRRQRLPPERRFEISIGGWYHTLKNGFFSHTTRGDKILNVVFVITILVAAGSVGHALVDQRQGEQYTELYLLTENDEGRLVADDYPTRLVVGESQSITVGIGNHEQERTSYTVVTLLQRTNSQDGTVSVALQEQLDRFEVVLAANETRRQSRELTPTIGGDRLRLLFLLYRGDPPSAPRADNAYRSVHLIVDVEISGN
jgi:uncharacterized membrane protein